MVRQAIGEANPNVHMDDLEVTVNWDSLRSSLIEAMLDTAHSRYMKWVESVGQ